MNEINHIPLPGEEAKEQSIRFIVASGMPERQRLSYALPKLYKHVGLRWLFFGVGECVFLAVLASILLWICLLAAIQENNALLYAVFAASPFLYASLHLMTVWKEIMSGTYEFMMICRCSLRQISVLRMFIFGGVCVVTTVMHSTLLGFITNGGVSILQAMSVSFSSLFLFAAMQLFAGWKWNLSICRFIAPICWVLLCLSLFFLGERSGNFIAGIPVFVFWIVSTASLSVCTIVLKQYYFKPGEGASTYAFG